MRKFYQVLVFSCLCILAGTSAIANEVQEYPVVKELQKDMPQDVVEFISRTAECNHWSGEEPYDKERADSINQALQKAGCAHLIKDEEELRSKYQKEKKILDTIEKAKDIFI